MADTAWDACERAIRSFEDAWTGAQRPDLAAYLPGDSPYTSRLLIELVQIELEFRIRGGEHARVEEYAGRFPVLRESTVLLGLVAAEFRLRSRHQMVPPSGEYERRFPQFVADLPGIRAGGRSGSLTPTRPHVGVGVQPTGRPSIPGYELGPEIGRGGMGVVYRAEQPALGRTVAIKTLAVIPGSEGAARFHRETEAIAHLDHPNIVPVYAVGEWNAGGRAVPYFVMKWYPGGSLDAMPNGPGTDVASAARTIEAVAHAIHHAHERGVLHRDLKPSNILLDDRGVPCVADFGLAGWFDASNPQPLTAAVVGTPSYMAPEQARDPSGVTTAADVYGLGAIFYHLLAGRPPFRAETALATLDLVVNRLPDSPAIYNSDVPRDIATICLKCLEKNPAHRYRTAEDLADDLARWRAGRPIVARAASNFERTWRLARRHPVATALAGATAAATFALIAVLATSNAHIREKEREATDALNRERTTNAVLTSALERESRAVYLDRVTSAARLWNANQLPQAWQQLDRCPEPYRRWEWHYLDSLRGIEPDTLIGHRDWVQAVAFLPGNRLVSGDSSGALRVWDRDQMTPTASWKLATGRHGVNGLAADPAGMWFAAVDSDALTVYDAKTLKSLRTLDGRYWVAASPDGRLLASSNGPTVRVWRAADWNEIATLPGHARNALGGCFSPDGGRLITFANDWAVRVWDVSSGQLAKGPWTRHQPVTGVAFTHDGRRHLEAIPQMVSIVNSETGELLRSVVRPYAARLFLAASRSTEAFATAGANAEIQIHDSITRGEPLTLRGHTGVISALAFDPDGKWLASVGSDPAVRVWNLNRANEHRDLTPIGNWSLDLAVAPDGKRLAFCGNSSIVDGTGLRIVDSRNGQNLRMLPGCRDSIFFADSRRIAACRPDGGVGLWDADNGVELRKWPEANGPFIRVAIDRLGEYIAAGSSVGHVAVWKVATGEEVMSFSAKCGMAISLDFNPDSTQLRVVGLAGFGVWDVRTQAPILDTLRLQRVTAAAFAPDGRWFASTESDRLVHIRDAATGGVVRTLAGSPTQLHSLAVHPDGSRLATLGRDGYVRIWDIESGQELLTLAATTTPAGEGNVAWSQDGDRLYSGHTVVRVWNSRNESK